jgi:pyroglutamyl-peptidase
MAPAGEIVAGNAGSPEETMRLLITGFEPFAGDDVNPSALVAARLAAEGFAGATTEHLILPVVRFRCVELVVAAIEQTRPDVVVMMGQAGGRPRITPERVAINLDDYRRPDNTGNQPVDEPIVPGGPAAYFSLLPIRDMVRRMQEAGVPAAISNSAGTYLCNHLGYGVLHYIAVRRLPVSAGFVHLPCLPEQATGRSPETPSMALEVLVKGMRVGVEAALAARERQTPALAAR